MGVVSDNLYMEAQNWGLGFNFLTYTGMFTTVISTGLTPIDDEHTHFRTAIIGKKDGRSEEETIQLLKAYMDDQSNAITQDFEIWENKRFRAKPDALRRRRSDRASSAAGCRQFYSKDWAARRTSSAARATMPPTTISRRDFLQLAGAAGAALSRGGLRRGARAGVATAPARRARSTTSATWSWSARARRARPPRSTRRRAARR